MVDGLADTLTHRPLIALVTLFGAGLVTSLTPCIYPMIPITAGILSGTSAGQPSRARTARLTLAYVTGLALFYAILGLIVGLFSGSVTALPRAGSWMVWVKKLSGVVLLGMAEYYFIQMGQVL